MIVVTPPDSTPSALYADYVDGETARVERVSLQLEVYSNSLILTRPEGGEIIWPLSDIREIPDQAASEMVVCTSINDPDARLLVSGWAVVAELRSRIRGFHQAGTQIGGQTIAKWALGAFASVAFIVFAMIPLLANQMARLLPPAGEVALGEATFEQIRVALGRTGMPAKTCNRGIGVAALNKMETALSQGLDLPYPVNLTVLDSPIVNAFALPGGQIVLFDGLLKAANSTDEVAAVLAHEIGHVAERDPTRMALRSAGSIGVLGLLFGDFAGGFVVLSLANTMIEANYSQSAETAADEFAHERLKAAGLRPDALADMFETMKKLGGDAKGIQAYFSSHPATDARINAAKAASAGMDANVTPILSRLEWRSLQMICK